MGGGRPHPRWAVLLAAAPGDPPGDFGPGASVIVGYLLDASRCALLDRDGYTTFVATAHPMRDPSPDELRALDVAGVGGLL